MRLARRRVLLGGGAALAAGAIDLRSARPAFADAAPQSRDVVLLHAGDAGGRSFAAAARAAMMVLAPTGQISQNTLGWGARVDCSSIASALDAARGRRLVAFVNNRDALILTTLTRRMGGVYQAQGLHIGGNGFSRHLIEHGDAMFGIAASLAVALQAGGDAYEVRSRLQMAAATAHDATTGARMATSWQAVLGAWLGATAIGAHGTAAYAVMARGDCAGRGEAKVSLLVDL